MNKLYKKEKYWASALQNHISTAHIELFPLLKINGSKGKGVGK